MGQTCQNSSGLIRAAVAYSVMLNVSDCADRSCDFALIVSRSLAPCPGLDAFVVSITCACDPTATSCRRSTPAAYNVCSRPGSASSLTVSRRKSWRGA